MKKLILLVLAILLCTSTAFAASAKPLKIGAILDFTGPAAMLGPLFKDGIVMALEENKNQVAGRPIELIAEDTAGDPAVSLEKARKLVERDKVNIIIVEFLDSLNLLLKEFSSFLSICINVDVVHQPSLITITFKSVIIYAIKELSIKLIYQLVNQLILIIFLIDLLN